MNIKMKEFGENLYNIEFQANIENGYIKIDLSTKKDELLYEYHLYNSSILVAKSSYSDNKSCHFLLDNFGSYRIKVYVKDKKKNIYSFFTDFLNYNEISALRYLNNNETYNEGIAMLSKLIMKKKKNEQAIENIIEKIQAVQSLDYTIIKYLKEKNINQISLYGYKDEIILAKLLWINMRYSKGFKIKHLLSDITFSYSVNVPRKIDIKFNKLDEKMTFEKNDIIVVCSSKKILKDLDVIQEKTSAKVIHITELLSEILLKQYIINPLIDIKNKNPFVNFIVCSLPNLEKVKNKSNNENEIIENNITLKQIRQNLNSKKPVIPTALKRFNKSAEFNKEIMGVYYLTQKDGVHFTEDIKSDNVNVIDNFRLTTNQPTEFHNTIYLFGNSVTFGLGTTDEFTIPSCLQKLINDNNKKYRVVNYANHASNDYDYQFKLMNNTNFKDGDIVISLMALNLKENDHFIVNKTQNLFDRPHDMGEIFIDKTHINKVGNELIAQSLYKVMKEKKLFSINNTLLKETTKEISSIIPDDELKELQKYKEFLLKNKCLTSGKNIGSIVMNCNPFTLGHRYLIEYAAKKVDHLYIFVVEEDKSYFPFKDRFMLIKKGTKDLLNVTVIPSGKFIISSLTFSDYFNKESLNTKIINMSDDVTIFAKEIAPILNITTRFVGEEPLCNVTKQYNNTLNSILPQFNINLEIIPRKNYSEEPISASRVRKLLKEQNFDEISKIVPKTTLNYLKKNFTNEKSDV